MNSRDNTEPGTEMAMVAAGDGALDNGARPTRILAIEDNPGDVALLKFALAEVAADRFELRHAATLSAGLQQLAQQACDVILLDLSLPDGQGIEMVERVQAQAAQTPVIVLTGLDDDRMANAAMGVGAQDYLIKGEFDGRLLVRAIRYAIQRMRAQEAQARYQDQAALNIIAASVNRSLQLDTLFDVALEKVLEVTGCEMAHIRVRNPVTGAIELAAHRGLTPEHVDQLGHERIKPGKLDQVFATGEVIVGRSSSAERIAKAGDRLIIWTPLKANNKVVGVLNVSTLRRDSFTVREVELLKAIGNVIGMSLENARLYTETRRHLHQVEALRDITAASSSSLNLSRVLKVLIERISKTLPYSAIAIRLFDAATGTLRPAASWNVENQEWAGSSGKPESGGLSQVVFEQKNPLAIRQFLADPRIRRPELFRRQGLVSYLGLPMLANGEGVGVLSIYTKFEHEFAADEIQFLAALANQAGMAIHNSQLYEQLSAQASELERSNKVKDEFLSVMSHEFRTPLNVIMGYSELLRDGTLGRLSPQQENALGKITDRSKDLLGLLTAVLDVTRLETDTVTLVNEVFDVGEFIGEAKAAFPRAESDNLEVQWIAPARRLTVQTDRRKLRHVLENLFNNALQFTAAGTIRVAAGHDPAAGTWSLAVIDTGVGIEADALPLIFQKFYQADSSSTRNYSGLGLGLYVAQRFVELMGGMIGVDSTTGVGSTFTVTLPLNYQEQCLNAEL